jgi:hypothetical protein
MSALEKGDWAEIDARWAAKMRVQERQYDITDRKQAKMQLELDTRGLEDDREQEGSKADEKDIDRTSAQPSEGQPSSKVTVEWPCKNCGAETKHCSDYCLQCGAAVYGQSTTTKKAGEAFKKIFQPVVVIVRRGGRSERATELNRFRDYVKRAAKLGHPSVTYRYYNDTVFRQRMQAQGWTNATIGRIDSEAQITLQPGIRSKEQITASTATVWRHVGDQEVDLSVAPRYHMSQESSKALWKNAKKRRGLVDQRDPQGSAAASDPRGSADLRPRTADNVLQWTPNQPAGQQSSSSSSGWQWAPSMSGSTGHSWSSSSSRHRDRSPNKIHGSWNSWRA